MSNGLLSARKLAQESQVTILHKANDLIVDPVNKCSYIKAEQLGEGGFAKVYKVYKVS